jgi:hypothetical protein
MLKITFWVTVIMLFGGVVSVSAQWQDLEWEVIEGDTIYRVFEPGVIPAIFEPTFISTATADEFYYDDEPLLVVTNGDEIHAYSTWHLVDHLVVNDRVGDRMITVTW